MRLFCLLLLCALCASCGAPEKKIYPVLPPEAETGFSHEALDSLLQKHVKLDLGRVDYRGLQKDREVLRSYVEGVGSAHIDALSKDEQMAFWINAYNAYTLWLILEHYPELASIRDLPDPWKQKRYKVAERTMSLDDIEHGTLRPVFRDPRIHFAVNCASVGCPSLQDRAWTGENLESMLEKATRSFVNDKRHLQIRDGEIHLSSIFKWYGKDFTHPDNLGHASSIQAYVRRYASPELAAQIRDDAPIHFLKYDWSLNDTLNP